MLRNLERFGLKWQTVMSISKNQNKTIKEQLQISTEQKTATLFTLEIMLQQ